MKRDKLDFSDNELRVVCTAIESYVNTRNRYFSTKSSRITNSVIRKLIDNGMKRKNPERIINNIRYFEEE